VLPEEALDEDFVAWLELQGGNRHERLMDLAGGSGAIGSISFGLSPGGVAKIDSLFLVMICVHLARFLVVAGSSERTSSLFSTLRLHLQSIATREDG
jgi:hypothetical protein